MQQLLAALHWADLPNTSGENVSELKGRPYSWALYIIPPGRRWDECSASSAGRGQNLNGEPECETFRGRFFSLFVSSADGLDLDWTVEAVSGGSSSSTLTGGEGRCLLFFRGQKASWLWPQSQQHVAHIRRCPQARTGLRRAWTELWQSAGGQFSQSISGCRLVLLLRWIMPQWGRVIFRRKEYQNICSDIYFRLGEPKKSDGESTFISWKA